MDITVVICTYNRCESLSETLESLRKQEFLTQFDYEIIVVDNNSKDKTKEKVFSYMPKFSGRLKYVLEPRQGLSYARNRGILESNGKVIAFTDDDVIVDKKWLSNIMLAFEKSNSACIGGRIYPVWESKIPEWVSSKFYGKLALLDYGDNSFEIKSEDFELFGANLIIDNDCFKKHGLFRTDIGRKGKRLFSGEDSAYVKLLLEKKEKVIYDPSIIVNHKISKERLVKSYFRKWSFDGGISYAELEINDKNIKTILSIPRYMIKQAVKCFGFYLISLLRHKKKETFFYECRMLFYISFFCSKMKKMLLRFVKLFYLRKI